MNKTLRPLFTLFFTLVLFSAANAEPYETIINNGSPQNRVDVAILGDGYTAAQMSQYRADAQTAMQKFFQQEPFLEYQRYFNVHRIDVVSNQSGADHSNRTPQVFVDTALDAAYNCQNIQRLVCVSNSKVNAAISRSLPASHFDIILVIVNDPEYGGSGGSLAVFSINTAAVEIALHEIGHSFGLLADEYTGGGPSCNPNLEPSQPNATRETNRDLIKWRHWIENSTPIPTFSMTSALAGLYEGSRYCDTGLYRPTFNNKMRTLGVPFEQINNEQFVKRIYNFVSPIDSVSPTATDVTISDAVPIFHVTTTKPLTHNLNISWLLDGQVVGNGESFTPIGIGGFTLGNHTLQAVISDQTSFVRNDPFSLLVETRTWNVNVVPGPRVPKTDFDFDGDGLTDISVYRNGNWYLQRTRDGFVGVGFGLQNDKLVPVDYDGDQKTDVAVYRGGTWYILQSRNGFAAVNFGVSDDIPVPADYDGDGKADIAVFRPSSGAWYLLRSRDGFTGVQFGQNGDKPVAADYDGDGKTDIAVARQANGYSNWYILRSSQGFYGVQFGIDSDKLVPADYDGDRRTDVAVYRSGNWYLLRSQDGFAGVNFGTADDIPTIGDYNGDGKSDIAVFRPSNGNWYRLNSGNNSFYAEQFGSSADIPVPTAFLR